MNNYHPNRIGPNRIGRMMAAAVMLMTLGVAAGSPALAGPGELIQLKPGAVHSINPQPLPPAPPEPALGAAPGVGAAPEATSSQSTSQTRGGGATQPTYSLTPGSYRFHMPGESSDADIFLDIRALAANRYAVYFADQTITGTVAVNIFRSDQTLNDGSPAMTGSLTGNGQMAGRVELTSAMAQTAAALALMGGPGVTGPSSYVLTFSSPIAAPAASINGINWNSPTAATGSASAPSITAQPGARANTVRARPPIPSFPP
jgi:hypothetical protein